MNFPLLDEDIQQITKQTERRSCAMTKNRDNLATEILGQLKKQLMWFKVALFISLIANIIQAAVIILK